MHAVSLQLLAAESRLQFQLEFMVDIMALGIFFCSFSTAYNHSTDVPYSSVVKGTTDLL
jgi:hypothetical protein